MKYIIIILVLSLITINAQSENELKVLDITESNLLVLSDSTLASLIDIEIPPMYHKVKKMSEIGEKAHILLRQLLSDCNIKIKKFSTDQKIIPIDILIIEKYKTVDPSVELLKEGLARIKKDTNSKKVEGYFYFEKIAKVNKRGLWSEEYLSNIVLDYDMDIIKIELTADRTKIAKKMRLPEVTEGKVFTEMLGGFGGAASGFLLGGLIGGQLTNKRGLGSLGDVFVGGATGMLIVAPLGVYIVAKHRDPNIKFFPLFVSSLAGCLVGVSLSSVSPVFIPIFTVMGAVIYSNAISPSLDQPVFSPVSKDELNKIGTSFQDFYNSKKIVDVEVFRLNF